MTKQSEVLNDPAAITCLDHGFVRLVDHMGTDSSIVQAARVSYGDGTKTVMEDRGLIRYLIRNLHTSPIEQCVVKLHIKMPIFVFRQWVRHRTASLNEYSGRYSIMTDEFYVPQPDVIQPQSKNNKQGRAGSMSKMDTDGVQWLIQSAYSHSYEAYKVLLGGERENPDALYDPYSQEDPLFDEEFNGVAREMARVVLPVGNYTELYWTQNLHNMMHLMKLRLDPHAQYEIRVFAQAVYDLLKPIYPHALEAFDDYVREAKTFSRMETNLIKQLLAMLPANTYANLVNGDLKGFAETNGMALSELKEFNEKLELKAK